jgi:hypothetical protein
MKKIVCVLAALLLLAVFPCAALADGLYEQYGPMWEWDEEQWLAAEDWSDEQWDEYYKGEEEAEELDRRQARLELGCPDPDGVNVKLNSAFLLFADAKPQSIDGGTYLPLRAFFSAAGLQAEFSYDSKSRSATVTCADGATLFVAVGDDLIIITQPGEEPEESYTYNEPLIIDGRMYVDRGDICLFLGWDSFWDYSNKILYIVNPEPLIEAVDKNFGAMNRLIRGSINLDMEQSYKFAGRIGLSGTLYGDEKNDAASASFSYEGLRQGLDIDINFALQLDLKQMQDSVFSGFDEATWSIIKAIDAGKGRLIMNSAEGAIYLQSNLLPLFDKQLKANDWLKLDYPAQELDMLFSGSILQDRREWFSLGRLIYESSKGYSFLEHDVYAETLKNVKMWQNLLGDANFKQTRSGGLDVYTLRADKKAIPGLSPYSLFIYGYNENMAELSGLLRFKEKEGRVEELEIKGVVQAPGAIPISYTFDYSGNRNKYQGYLEIKGRYLGKLLFSMEYEATPTTELPSTAPPKGSRIVDEEDSGFSPIRLLMN